MASAATRGQSRRVADLSASVTLEVAARAMRAAGEGFISFGASGRPELRKAVARKAGRNSVLPVRPERVVISNGPKGAIFLTFEGIFGPVGDAFLPVPCWTSYPERVRLAEADPAVGASRKKLESWQ